TDVERKVTSLENAESPNKPARGNKRHTSKRQQPRRVLGRNSQMTPTWISEYRRAGRERVKDTRNCLPKVDFCWYQQNNFSVRNRHTGQDKWTSIDRKNRQRMRYYRNKSILGLQTGTRNKENRLNQNNQCRQIKKCL